MFILVINIKLSHWFSALQDILGKWVEVLAHIQSKPEKPFLLSIFLLALVIFVIHKTRYLIVVKKPNSSHDWKISACAIWFKSDCRTVLRLACNKCECHHFFSFRGHEAASSDARDYEYTETKTIIIYIYASQDLPSLVVEVECSVCRDAVPCLYQPADRTSLVLRRDEEVSEHNSTSPDLTRLQSGPD